jgi:hypothetical protein
LEEEQDDAYNAQALSKITVETTSNNRKPKKNIAKLE